MALLIPWLTFIVLLTEPVAAITSEQCVTVWAEWGQKQWVTKVGVNESRYFHYILVVSWEKIGGKNYLSSKGYKHDILCLARQRESIIRFAESQASQD